MDFQTPPLTETFPWQHVPAADFAVLAQDAGHSLSPRMHNAAFREMHLPYKYIAINVPRGEVAAALDHLRDDGYVGVNVTMPHKEEALAWCETFTNPEYPEVKAANTILLQSRTGYNTDTVGFLRSLKQLALQKRDKCLVLGAGGSANACIAVLLKLGCEVSLWNRTKSRAIEMNLRFGGRLTVVEDPAASGFNLLVNATSVGKIGGELPIDWSRATPQQCAYDLYYSKSSTPFIAQAQRSGLRTMDGTNLLVFQGAEAWRCWGLPEAPVNLMVKEVHDALAG